MPLSANYADPYLAGRALRQIEWFSKRCFLLDRERKNTHGFIMWTLALFFGWLLSFPFFGPLLPETVSLRHENQASLYLVFALFHALTFFAGGVLLKQNTPWLKIMTWSLGAVVFINTLLWYSPPGLWPAGMALLGVFAALYILGWSCPYAMGVAGDTRLKLMALTIFLANMIYLLLKALAIILPPPLLLVPLLCPLFVSLYLLLRRPAAADYAREAFQRIQYTLPIAVILIVALFIFGLYLNSGFMYRVMQPALNHSGPMSTFYRYIPYKLVLLLMFIFGGRLKWSFSVFMGVSLLGLAFISFAILDHDASRFYMTETLIQAAFALLDLFCWVLLGYIASIYKAPARIFGFGLGSMLASIVAGELIGGRLLLLSESYRLATALFAASAIFLTFLIIPWLDDRVVRPLQPALPWVDNAILGRLTAKVPGEKEFTAREEEIIKLILEGLSNEEIARTLFISPNTLKTHLKHIYQKAGVSRKRELISLALKEQETARSAPQSSL